MDVSWWLKELTVLIVVCEITITESDLLESLQPREGNPPELNEFLVNVLEHKNDFDIVKQAARKYQKMKKDAFGGLDSLSQSQDIYNEYDGLYKIDRKRRSHFHHRRHKKPRTQPKKSHRFRRHLPVSIFTNANEDREEIVKEEKQQLKKSRRDQKPGMQRSQMPSDIFKNPEGEKIERRELPDVNIESEGETGTVDVEADKNPIKEKKEAMNFESAVVHRTYKENKDKKQKQKKKTHENQDFYYVDLGKSAEEEQERRNDRRGSKWYPNPRYYYKMANRPALGRVRERFDYPVYETEPLHHNLNDEIAFEKALSYEIEPSRREPFGFNSPQGNNLYSVDAGRPDNLEPIPQRRPMQGRVMMIGGDGQDVTNERFFMDNNNNLRKSDNSMHMTSNNTGTTTIPVTTTTTVASVTEMQKSTEAGSVKVVKQVGEGFIEITKADKDATKNNNFNDESDIKEDTSSGVIEEPLVKQNGYQSRSNVPALPVYSHEGNQPPVIISTLEGENIVDSRIERHYIPRSSDDKREKQSFSNIDTVDSEDSYAGVKNENNEKSNILSKHSLHPLRVRDNSVQEKTENFLSRKLQFVDEKIVEEFDNQDDDYNNYIPHRKRRDFLDALGMKNEEDYSEDNPYKDMVTDNNTDVNNDTFCKNVTTKAPGCSTTTAITPTSNKCVQKQDMNNIKEVLEEPKETNEVTSVANFKEEKESKRSKKSISEFTIYKDDDSSNSKERIARHIPTDIKTKILQNKDKIYNYKEDSQSHNVNSNYYSPVKRGVRPQNWFDDRPLFKTNINVKKSAGFESEAPKDEFGVDLPTTITPCNNYTEVTSEASSEISSEVTSEVSEPEVNSTYEQVANQMDLENEKLAQMVNGQLASKIVSTVFDALKEKTPLKTKFYPGLSRKHVNYAGTIDCDIFKANETEDVAEAHLLLGQITKVLNKLVLNQVRRKLCQRLPDDLKEFLGELVNIKTALQGNSFEPNKKQGKFLFTYQEKAEPPFDVKKLQETLAELEGLLLSYHNLNSECQSRVQPVKDYIERHVNVLKQIVSCPSHNCGETQEKRHARYSHNSFRKITHNRRDIENLPSNDVDSVIKSRTKSSYWKTDQKRDTQRKSSGQSSKYKKLQQAAQKIREKRAYEKKIAEMFGGKEKRSAKRLNVDYEQPVVYSLG